MVWPPATGIGERHAVELDGRGRIVDLDRHRARILDRGRRIEDRKYALSGGVADHALMGFARPVTNRATHYHTTAVDPHWNDTLVRTRRRAGQL
mgnify:CR=1 FL=1